MTKYMKSEIQLGNSVMDMVSGIKGIAVSRIEYLNGCTQIGIMPKSNDGLKQSDTAYVDYKQVKVIGKGVKIHTEDTGGPMSYAPKN